MTIRTKICCTIGPSTASSQMIRELMLAGMNIARLNFSHGTHEGHLEVIERLKEVRNELKLPLAIMLDTKGPEIRLGKFPEGSVVLTAGSELVLTKSGPNTASHIQVLPPEALDALKPGTRVLFDDGNFEAVVKKQEANTVTVYFENGGVLKSGKKLNVPGVEVGLPALTEQDIADLHFGAKHGIDLVAASFVRCRENVLEIKKVLAEAGAPHVLVIAKIEDVQGVENFDSIVKVAGGIMVARGDLGVEVPLSIVPKLQKRMIRQSNGAARPVITATQMLESMIICPRPTRAEASDVANAIYDATSCLMLSAETATGKYPLEAVKTMTAIAKETESDFDYRSFFASAQKAPYTDISTSVASAAVSTAFHAKASAIFVFTTSGTMAKLIAAQRPPVPVLAFCVSKTIFHQMSVCWGVTPLLIDECKDVTEAFKRACAVAVAKGLAHKKDLVVVTAGAPFGISGTTNMLMVENVV